MTHVNPNLDQDSFRGRNDDGSESAATWKATVNTDWTQAVDENFRIRFLVQEDAGGTENNVNLQLQYNHNGAGWNSVNGTSSVVQSSLSGNFTEDDNTTQQIGAGTFITPNSGMDEDEGLAGELNDIDFAGNDEVEVEYCCQILSGDVSDTDTIQLRVVRGDLTVLETYTNTPTVTVSESGGQEFTQTLSATATGSASIGKDTSKTLSVAATVSPNLTKQTGKSFSVSASGTPGLTRQTGKTLSATSTGSATLDTGLQFTKTLAATAIGSAQLTASIVFTETLSVIATGVASIAKRVGKGISATATAVSSISKQIGKNVSATASGVATVTKRTAKQITTTSTGSASVSASATFLHTESATANVMASLVTEFQEAGGGGGILHSAITSPYTIGLIK